MAITGSTAVNHLGTGTTTLSGSNTYSGDTTLEAGTLSQGVNTAFSPNSAYVVNGGTLDLNDFAFTAAAFSGSGGAVDLGAAILTIVQAIDTTYAGSIFGVGGSITKQGVGNLTLSNSNTYTGGTTISEGTLTLGHATDTLTDNGSVAISGGNLAMGINSDTVGTVSLSSGSITGTGTLTASNYSFTDSGSASANLDSTGGLSKTGFGTVTLTGTNTYSGGTTVTGGLINFANAASFGTGTITLNGGGLQWASGNTIDISDRLNPFGSDGATFDTNGNNITLTTALNGTGNLTKQGTGTLSLNAANTYTGETTISAGTLAVSGNGSISNPSKQLYVGKLVGDNGTLEIENGGSFSSSDGLVGYDSGSTGSIDVAGSLANSNALILGFSGSGALTIQANGLASSSYSIMGYNTGATGTADVSGTLTLDDTFTVGQRGNGTLTIRDGGMVNVSSGVDDVLLAEGTSSTGRLNISGATDAGILKANSVTGGQGTATLNFNHSDSDYRFTRTGAAGGTAVAITGSTAVNHLGTGTTTLSGANTYFGDTTVSAGNLVVDGSASNSAFNINGGILSGSGTVGALTIASGGTLAPGNSPGTLNASSTTWESGGIYEWEINNATGTAGTNWDLLNILGDLNLTATSASPFTIKILSLTESDETGDVPNFDQETDYSYSIAMVSDEIIGFSSDAFAIDATGFTNNGSGEWSIVQNNKEIQLLYHAVPEPVSFALLAGIAALGVTSCRRRYSAKQDS